MYFIDTGDTQVVGASPEILARLQYDDAGRGTVTVRPLAGTRPRGKTPEEDAALEAELPADPKERSEHLMLIDLARNDVGRVADPGRVKDGEPFVFERYSHVMHTVTEVPAALRDGLGYAAVTRAAFLAGPAGGPPTTRGRGTSQN